MIIVRKSAERYHDGTRMPAIWHTFARGGSHEGRADALANGFGRLEVLNEHRLQPGGSVTLQESRDCELVSYVREGTLAYEDATGRPGVLHTDEFQSTILCRGVRHTETNASQTNAAHIFQIGMHPCEGGLAPGFEQKRFSSAQRQGRLCVVASPDGRNDSLRIDQDGFIYSALLEAGTHVIHELAPGRSAWLHIVRGRVTFGDLVLVAGDGAGVSGERAFSLTARETTEVLLIDLGEQLPMHPVNNERSERS